jgi:carboxymethylenebutenolidase
MAIQTEFVTLGVSDGSSMRAYVAHPEGHPKAGLMVFQEIFGINAHIRDITERFAREGYLAVAPELFHRTGEGFESGYTDMAPGREHAQKTTDAGLAADIHSAFNWIHTHTPGLKVAAAGYCMGGRVAALAAMTVPLACGIAYYGGGIAPHPFYKVNLIERMGDIGCPMLFCWGGKDHFIPPDAVHAVTSAMRAANKPFASVEFSDADHGFFCDARASYHAAAAAQSWPLTLAYLANYASAAKTTGA